MITSRYFRAICRIVAVASLATATAYGVGGYVDGVVATVGREAILHSDVMQEMMPMLQAVKTETLTAEEQESRFNELFEQALEQVIEYHILYREALAFEVEIPDEDVEKRIAKIRKQYDSSEDFQKALEESGHTVANFRERMYRQMMALSVSRSKRFAFEKEAVVSESDIAQYYKEHSDQFHFPARYRVRRIFVQAGSEPEARQAAKETVEALREELVGGGDFAEAAKEHSDGPEADQGGLIGWVLPGDLVEPLNSAIATMTVAEISDVLETEYGLHLLSLEETEGEGSLSLQEARNEIEPLLRQQRGEERYRQWMNSLRRRNNVRVML